MKAVVINSHGPIDVLKVKDIDIPICSPNQVKVNIKASSINHLDIWVRRGIPGINTPLPMVLGSDGAGVVTEVGNNIGNVKIGDRVVIQPGTYSKTCVKVSQGMENFSKTYGILGETENGVQCEYVCLKPENIYPMHDELSFIEASSMQLVFMTAYQMLIKRAALKPLETVLVYGGASGIGTAAIQIAKDLGAKVIATVGSDSKLNHALKFGADYVFNHSSINWVKKIKDVAGDNMIDVVFEHVAKETWNSSMRLLGIGGRIVTCGSTTGYDVNIDLRYLFSKQQSIIGSTMADIDTFKKVQQKIKKNIYTPFVDKIYSMKDIKKAHKRIESRENLGKVVIVPD